MSWLSNEGQELLNLTEILEKSNPEEPLVLIKKIEKASRGEFGNEPIKFFSNPTYIQKLMNIGRKYASENDVLVQVLATLRKISERCRIKPQNMYEFFLSNIDSTDKKIKKQVAYAIPFFPQFDEYENKWGFILTIPKIAPKKDSMRVFRWIIESNCDVIPEDLKGEISRILVDFIRKRDLDIDTHRRYTDVIDKLGDGANIASQPHE